MPQAEPGVETQNQRPQRRASTLGGCLAIVLWSSTIALTRSLSEQLGPLTAGTAVYTVGACLSFIPRRAPAEGKLSPPYLWGCGALFVLYAFFLYLAVGRAIDREQVIEIGLVNYLWPAFTLLFAGPLLHQSVGGGLLVGTAIALGGVFLVMTQGAAISWTSFSRHVQGSPVAFSLAFGAAVCWALYSNLSRRWAIPGSNGAVKWFMAVTALTLLLLRLLSTEQPHWNSVAIAELIFLGGTTALAYALWEQAMRQGDLVLVAAVSYFTPLLSTLVSCAYLWVTVSPRLWLGAALLVAGSILSWRSVGRREQRRP